MYKNENLIEPDKFHCRLRLWSMDGKGERALPVGPEYVFLEILANRFTSQAA